MTSIHAADDQSASQFQIVGYLDLGVGGYIDIGTSLTDEELGRLPKGRHALAIIGTYGINGYVPVQLPLRYESAQGDEK
jgi:hypothetical protein